MASSQATSRELIEQLRSENSYLRDQLGQEREANRENRRLLAAALRMPAIEAAEPSQDAAQQTAQGDPDRARAFRYGAGERRTTAVVASNLRRLIP